MTDSDNEFTWMMQKSLFQGSQLLNIGMFVAAGLLGGQPVMAQADALAIPQPTSQPTIELPAVQPAPAAPTVVPEVIQPVRPNSVVPDTIDTPAATPGAASYGTVFMETEPAAPAAEAPAVDVISPTDYSNALIDTTDYNVGATMPSVVLSERSSGCEFSLQAGAQVANAACGGARLAASIANGIAPGQSSGGTFGSRAIAGIPGFQLPGGTTTAGRDYYNDAVRSVVQLQLGETFVFPLTVPASITSLFGWRIHPIFADRRFHTGTDLGAPMGTPVVATQAGRVTLSDYLGGYGLTVMLRHNDNTLESRYAHLSRLLVQPGEWVDQGEVIGLVGSTGNSTGPHLHFELRRLTANGWAIVNPDSVLKQTLGTLVQVLGNPLGAIASNPVLEVSSTETTQGLPFRPAQPNAN